ncbi:MAG: AI-2E family transporter [Pseudomonadales bacterium]
MKFVDVISGWVNRHFSNEEAIYLVLFIGFIFVFLAVFGTYLAPVITGLVIAFLIQGIVVQLVAWRVPEALAIGVVMVLFLGALVALFVGVLPLVWRQMNQTVAAMPGVIDRIAELFANLSATYPALFSQETVTSWLSTANVQLTELGGVFLQALVGQLPNAFGLVIFFLLAPISVFFFLKDKDRLVSWFTGLLPTNRPLLERVGAEMTEQIGNYVRGKAIEILIVGVAMYVTFAWLDLNYAALLGLLVGLSVLVPFVGAAVVTLPVVAVGLLQFGWSADFFWIVVAYFTVQAVDGMVLAPKLFSVAVNLHPITIIVAVLAFGGIWGFWGVFFAIPLATLVKAIYVAWPRQGELGVEDDAVL